MQTRRGVSKARVSVDPFITADDRSLSSLTVCVVEVAQRLRYFTVNELKAQLGEKCVSRRVYDALAILLGCGFISVDPFKSRSYRFEGVNGVRELVALHRSGSAKKCPFNDGKQLRCQAWELIKMLAPACSPACSPAPEGGGGATDSEKGGDSPFGGGGGGRRICYKSALTAHFGTRRFYDLVGVMRAVGLINVTRRWNVALDESVCIAPRMTLAVSDEDAAAIWPELTDWLQNEGDAFIF